MTTLTPELEEIVYFFHKRSNELPREQIDALTQGAHPSVTTPANLDDMKFRACLWAYYQQSLREMERLGYKEHGKWSLLQMHRPVVILEVLRPTHDPNPDPITQGYRHFSLEGFSIRVILAAQPYGLLMERGEYHDPDSMWEIIAWRRDGDAVIFLAGDDRDYLHVIGLVWSPERYQPDSLPHALL